MQDIDRWLNIIGLFLTVIVAPLVFMLIVSAGDRDKKPSWFSGICKCGHAKSHHDDTMLYKLVCLKNIWRPSKYSDEWELRNARNIVSFCDCQTYRRDWFAFREHDGKEREYQKLKEAAEEKELRDR